MSADKRLRREQETMRMEVMEPRMLLSADLMALAGLPGADHSEDDTPWDQFPSDPSEPLGDNPAIGSNPPSPLALSVFNSTIDGYDSSGAENDHPLTLLSDSGQSETISQLLFVDTRVPDYAALIDQIRQSHAGDGLRIYLIDASQDGVVQITDALANHNGVDAVQIISHGSADGLQLGTTWLNGDNVNAYSGQFSQWSACLTDDADLLLYGCDLAADADGRALVDAIAELTSADVAASDDMTGHHSLGGDWELEYQQGAITASQLSFPELRAEWIHTLANAAPVLVNNTLSLNQGETVLLDSTMLSATDADNVANSLQFSVSGVSNGWFALAADTATPITSFTQQQISDSDVVFVHDGGELAPDYLVSVADAEPLSDGPAAATISFSGTNEGVLWLSTDSHVSGANGVPGLDAGGWQQGDLLQQANPNLSFGEAATNGTFSVAFDASDFSSNPNINGIHFVSSSVTVGGINPINLQAGDLLLTTADNNSFTSNGSSPPADLNIKPEDIFYFRPDMAGDYSSGNFYMLLTDPFGSNTEVRGLSLVEKDVWMGDYWLHEGDLLMSRSGGAEDNDIWVMRTDTLDSLNEATYQSIAEKLIEGDDVGVDLDGKIYGLDVLESATAIGGKSYNPGTLLVSLDSTDSSVGVTNQQVDRQDIVALEVIKTSLGSGAGSARVSASVMFDGDDSSGNDVNFDSSNEEIDALTLTIAPSASNTTPSLVNNALTLNEGETVTVTNTMLSASDSDNLDSGLRFNFSGVSGGQFELTGDPGNAVTSFSQQQISDGAVVFVDNGDQIAPSFNISVSDGSASTAPVAGVVNFSNVNDAGAIAIDDTTPDQGQTLIATVTDADGASGVIGYQWYRNGVAISGATASFYTTTQTDVGKTLTVSASYTDDLSSAENPVSAATASVANVNDAGSIAISDATPDQGQTLIATVTDADGASGVINYLWFRNGVVIPGQTTSVYTPVQVDVGKALFVAASYTDDFGAVETPVSSVTAVVANVNDAGSIAIGDTTPEQGQTLTASVTDADGATGAIDYQWYRNGIAISGATSNIYTTVQADVGMVLTVGASYTDDLARVESPVSSATAPVANGNVAGTVTIDDTTPVQNQILTAGVTDDDGIPGTISYQWYRDGIAISGATGSTYTTSQADVGKVLTVSATYTDDDSVAENPISGATAAVTDVNDAPTFSLFNDALGSTDEDTEVEITLATMLAVGDEDDIDIGGSVDGFIVKSIASGTLRIGANAAAATPWNPATNASIDATHNAYWTPAANANGILNAFVAAAFDNSGVESTGSATGQVIVRAVNDAPGGLPAINGAAREHITLTADTTGISDVDGLGTFKYQWLRDSIAVYGATGGSYKLDDIDVGARMSVSISYVDGDGTTETLTSAQTAVVSAVNDAPIVVRNQLTLSAGDSIVLNGAMLAATDQDNADTGLLFTVTAIDGGRFELVSNPGVAITSFTQAQVSAGQVRFVDDGDVNAPDYTLEVSDGLVGVASRPTIDFVPDPSLKNRSAVGTITGPVPVAAVSPVIVTAEAEIEGEDEIDDAEGDAAAAAPEETASEGEETAGSEVVDEPVTAADVTRDSSDHTYSTTESGLGFQSILNDNALRNPFVNMLLGALASPDIPAVPKLLASEINTVLTTAGFLGDLDRIRDNTNQTTDFEQQRVASTIAVSTGLSIGYVAWLIRSGVLLSTVLSSLPAWHFVDPLPVLGTIAATGTKRSAQDEEEDSVESMFKDQTPPADNTGSGRDSHADTDGSHGDLSEHKR